MNFRPGRNMSVRPGIHKGKGEVEAGLWCSGIHPVAPNSGMGGEAAAEVGSIGAARCSQHLAIQSGLVRG